VFDHGFLPNNKAAQVNCMKFLNDSDSGYFIFLGYNKGYDIFHNERLEEPIYSRTLDKKICARKVILRKFKRKGKAEEYYYLSFLSVNYDAKNLTEKNEIYQEIFSIEKSAFKLDDGTKTGRFEYKLNKIKDSMEETYTKKRVSSDMNFLGKENILELLPSGKLAYSQKET
jgi:hypothetical protein